MWLPETKCYVSTISLKCQLNMLAAGFLISNFKGISRFCQDTYGDFSHFKRISNILVTG